MLVASTRTTEKIYTTLRYLHFLCLRALLNLLRWNDVPRTSRIFCSKIAIFPQFQVYLRKTNLLLLFSDITPTSSKEKATNYCIRFGHSLRSAISCQRKGLTSCHARRKYLAQNCNISSVLSMFKYNPGKTNNKFVAS